MPSIFDYKDYRHFLRDTYHIEKTANPSWSYACWAKALGFNSHATLSMIISGQRNPGKKVVDAFADYFSFNPQEQTYFSKLVSIHKSVKDPGLSLVLVDKYLEIQKSDGPENIFDWLINLDTAILCQLIKLPDFTLEPTWFKKRLNIQLGCSIDELLEALKKYHIIECLADGRIERKESLDISGDPTNDQIRNFHLSALKSVEQAYDHVNPNDGIFGTLTFNIKQEDIPRFRQKLQEIHRQLVAEFENDCGDEAALVNYNFFPLTSTKKD